MVKTNDILKVLTELAPVEMKMDFDNVGLLVGRSEKEVRKILVSLDVTNSVIEEAIAGKADLIVSHHPLFFGLKSVSDSDLIGKKILKLIENGIAAISMHTNLDAANGGVNDALAKKIGLLDTVILTAEGTDNNGEAFGYGRVGVLAEDTEFGTFLAHVKNVLASKGLRYVSADRPVKKVAVMGGSGGSSLKDAVNAGCDTFVTADIKYDVFLDAAEYNINLIDADHFCTENVVVPELCKYIKENFSDVEVLIAKSHGQTISFI